MDFILTARRGLAVMKAKVGTRKLYNHVLGFYHTGILGNYSKKYPTMINSLPYEFL